MHSLRSVCQAGSLPTTAAAVVHVSRTNEVVILDHVLRDRNPGFLKSEIGPLSDFDTKSYLVGMKSAHFHESGFQESGEVDKIFKMGTHFH